MVKIILILIISFGLSGCTTYEGAAYIKKDLDNLACSRKPAPTSIDIKTAKVDCIKDVVDEEFFKGGASIMVVDSIRGVNRYRYASCMDYKGYFCTW